MYYSIEGKILYKDESLVAIEAGQSGLAFEILIAASTYNSLPKEGENTRLFTKLIVRENDTFLVGFSSIEDKKLYETLITVSGIGPKHGLKLLSDLTASQIRQAIISNDTTQLSRVKGIGPKTASRIILELKDKMKKLSITDEAPIRDGITKKKMEVLLAMRVLGYSDYESKNVIEKIFEQSDRINDMETEDIIKLVLSSMAR